MRNRIILFGLLLIICYCCPAQVNQTPATPPSRRNDAQHREDMKISRNAEVAFRDLRSLDIPQTFQKTPLEVIGQDIQPLYRKPGKKDLKDLVPSAPLLTEYDQFLRQPNTGIFKLSADSSCARNATVLVATENCASNTIPGGGTAYSFRVNSHRILHLADLTLDKDVIKTDGIMQQGIMVNLGKLDLAQISADTNGLKFLLDFKPAANKVEMQKNDEDLSVGIKADGFIYRIGFYADADTTFALRSIAYRGKMMRSVKGVNYNELDYDKRKDVIIVFKIVEKDSNGDITVIWKEITKKDSPNLKDN